MMEKKGKRNNILNRLYIEQLSLCCYCRKPTKLIIQGRHPSKASIEHLYSKNDIRRLLVGGSIKYVVMACTKCNNTRGGYEKSLLKSYNICRGIYLDITKPFEEWYFPMEPYIFPEFN